MNQKKWSELNNYFTEIIDTLVTNCSLGDFFDDFLKEEYNDGGFCKFTHSSYDKFVENIDYGASKLCIIPFESESDFVLKIPLPNASMNYCEIEAENYSLAVTAGVESFFAECVAINEYTWKNISIPLYVMKRARVDEEEVYLFSGNDKISSGYYYDGEIVSTSMDGKASWHSGNECEGEEVVEDLFWKVYHSSKLLEKFWEFISENNINDLHEKNVGFLDDGSVVCIDYSGY